MTEKNVKVELPETIKECVDLAYAAIRKAEKIADETQTGFSFNVSYGMGGYYEPRPKKTLTKEEALKILQSGKEISDKERKDIIDAIENESIISDTWYDSAYLSAGWQSSSQGC